MLDPVLKLYGAKVANDPIIIFYSSFLTTLSMNKFKNLIKIMEKVLMMVPVKSYNTLTHVIAFWVVFSVSVSELVHEVVAAFVLILGSFY